METYGEILKHSIEQQINLNGYVDGFCVKYLRDLHARNASNKLNEKGSHSSYMDANTEKVPDKSASNSDDEKFDEDTDSDYNEDSKGQTRQSRGDIVPSGRTDSNYKSESDRSSNRLSKSARSFLRKCKCYDIVSIEVKFLT